MKMRIRQDKWKKLKLLTKVMTVMDKVGTIISISITFPEKDTETCSIHSSRWDLKMEDLFDILERLCHAVGYGPKTVDEFFRPDLT